MIQDADGTFENSKRVCKMKKPFPALCKDCKWTVKPDWAHNLRCYHPKVVGQDAWALGSISGVGEAAGKSCTDERGEKWFAQCGMKGKLWEPKESHDKINIKSLCSD